MDQKIIEIDLINRLYDSMIDGTTWNDINYGIEVNFEFRGVRIKYNSGYKQDVGRFTTPMDKFKENFEQKAVTIYCNAKKEKHGQKSTI